MSVETVRMRTLYIGLTALLLAPAGNGHAEPIRNDHKAQGSTSADFFGTTRLWKIHLVIPAKEYETMEPIGGMRFPGMPGGPGRFPGGPKRQPKRPAVKPTDTHKGGGFGMEFPWVHGELTVDGKTYKNLAIRYKGNISYLTSAGGLKRNFKIDFDHYDPATRFYGMKKISLNAGAMDHSREREALAYAVFRAAGVPAPRTCYAEVTLTVPGKYDKELLGLYTVVEQVDKTFLKDRFKSSKGLLLKPENVRSVEYLGDDWSRYKARYRPKREPSKEEARRVLAFAQLVNAADDDQFRKEIAGYLDVDQFLRFTAVNSLIAHIDSFSYFMFGHNYYLYLDPTKNTFVYLPWDVDLTFAGFPMGATPDQQMDLSVLRPYAGEHKLIERLLAMKDVKEKYHKILTELSTSCFSKERLLKEIEAIQKVTKEPLARETKAAAARKERIGGFRSPGGMMRRTPDLRTFVERRTESVATQLAGTRQGYVPPRPISPGFPGGR